MVQYKLLHHIYNEVAFVINYFISKWLFLCLQPLSQWTSSNVVEWMAALNLYRYAELFKSKDIKGADLITLDREKLMVRDLFIIYVFTVLACEICSLD